MRSISSRIARKSASGCTELPDRFTANENGPLKSGPFVFPGRFAYSAVMPSRMAASRTAFCTFSKARTSIWRTRSRLML